MPPPSRPAEAAGPAPGGTGARTRRTARGIALEILRRVESDGAYADRLLDVTLRQADLDARDRGLVTELVYGTLRWQRWLDGHLAAVSRRPVPDLADWVRALLRLSAYQLAYLGRIPPRAVVHEAVELAKARRPRGAADFVNGVLRALSRRPRPWPPPLPPPGSDAVEAVALRTSQPTWLVRRWIARLGPDEGEALARAMNERPPLALRVNTLRGSVETVRADLERAGLAVRRGAYAPEALVVAGGGDPRDWGPLRRGACTVQDEAAMLVGHLLGPEPGETVADVCAAPGTKTTHLAQLMADQGRIVATDPHPARLRLLREACRRLGATIVEAREGPVDALARDLGAVCDRALVDAPCSNLGVLRRNPDGKWRRQPADLEPLAAVQGAILDHAAALVRPGGVLVYATCSLEPEENEEVIRAFRARRPEFAPDPAPARVPAACLAAPGVLRTWPHRHDVDGFTAHRLRRSP